MRETGYYQTLGDRSYFIPHSLPPLNPSFTFNAELISLYGEASFALGKLNEMSLRLPNSQSFIKAYAIKEALLSSEIEGIHTTLVDVYAYPLDKEKADKNTQLVVNYTAALDGAVRMIQKEGFPLVSRVILNAHKVLLSDGEGEKANPGYYRREAVRVGNLVPPPVLEVPKLMGDLEKYINNPSELPPLIRAGLAHVQFETIHPFLDGNGRIGRLLIVLMLLNDGLLTIPVLYPSYYFKKHHLEYYQTLDRVRTQGDFEGWIAYYLRAIKESALDAHKRAEEIESLDVYLWDLIDKDPQFTRMKETARLVLDSLFAQPIAGSITEISQELKKAYNTIGNVLKKFLTIDIVTEKIYSNSKVYQFDPYIKLLLKEYT